MNTIERKEFDSLQNERKLINDSLTVGQITLANQLKNGLGKTIKEELKNPPKPNKIKGFKYKIKRFFNMIKEKIKYIFIYNDNNSYGSEN